VNTNESVLYVPDLSVHPVANEEFTFANDIQGLHLVDGARETVKILGVQLGQENLCRGWIVNHAKRMAIVMLQKAYRRCTVIKKHGCCSCFVHV
jgi:hypothetical protein